MSFMKAFKNALDILLVRFVISSCAYCMVAGKSRWEVRLQIRRTLEVVGSLRPCLAGYPAKDLTCHVDGHPRGSVQD